MNRQATDTIRLTDSFSLPTLEFASQGNAVLGIRDSGKSYTATLLAERLCEAGIPFVAFDPIGVWRFLKVPGAGRGYPVVVAHPKTGDIPLTVESAPGIVRAAMQANVSLVIDLYAMDLAKADWRRIVESAVKVLLFENGEHGLRHIFIEEAAEFCPQRVGPEQGKVYSVIESLARMGGNAKLGYTLINQRAEEVNKAVLELCDCLFLMRQKGRNSLTALSKWLDFGGKAKSREIIGSIAQAATGEAWIWPRAEAEPVHVRIPKKNSFHPNRRSTTAELQSHKPVNVETFVKALRTRLQKEADEAAKPEAKLGDDSATVKELRAYIARQGERVAELEAEAKKAMDLEWLKDTANAALLTVNALRTDLDEVEARLKGIVKSAEGQELIAKTKPAAPDHFPSVPGATFRYPVPAKSPAANGELSQGQATLLRIAAEHHPVKLTASQLGVLGGYTPSTVRTYMPKLRARALLVETPDGYQVTDRGFDAIGGKPSAVPMTKPELRQLWISRLSEGEGKILGIILNRRGRAMDMAALIEESGYTASTVRTYLPTLRRNKLIDARELKASPTLLD